jgi:SSS family transporter
MSSLSAVDLTIAAIYLIVVFGLGLWFCRKQETNADYFLGGRNMHWLPIGLSLFATTFSSNSFVGLPAEAAYQDYHLLLAIWFIPLVVAPLACIYFVPFYRKLRLISLHEYFERRFNRKVRLAASVAFMAYSAGWMGTMLVAAGKIMEPIVGAEGESTVYLILIGLGVVATVYTAIGGVKAVIWTDSLQAFALGGGMIFLLFIIVGKIDGGWAGMVERASEHHKFDLFRTDGGFQSPNLFSACAFGFFVYLAAEIASFTSVQRYASVPSIRDARLAVIVKGVFIAFSCTLFFVIGTSLFVFYGDSAPDVFARFNDGKMKDQLLPHFVLNYATGVGMTGLLLAGVFAAAMSSLDSSINSMTATVVHDWMRGREVGANVNRVLTGAFGALAVAIACVLQTINLPIFSILMSVTGATMGVLLAVLLLGMLVKRANTEAAYAAIPFGLGGYGLARYLAVQTWWDGAFVVVFGFVGGLVVMGFFRPSGEDQLKGLMLRGKYKPR